MNRVIKFRGIREKTNEWVYGYLVKREEPFLHDIIDPVGNQSSITYAIKRGTEGQFTGLTDRNGKGIYEGDVIKYWHKELAKVTFRAGCFVLRGLDSGYEECIFELDDDAEVVGNIYEHPHLLEGVK